MVIILFRLVWNSVWCQINLKSVIIIQIWLDLTRFRKSFLCVRSLGLKQINEYPFFVSFNRTKNTIMLTIYSLIYEETEFRSVSFSDMLLPNPPPKKNLIWIKFKEKICSNLILGFWKINIFYSWKRIIWLEKIRQVF